MGRNLSALPSHPSIDTSNTTIDKTQFINNTVRFIPSQFFYKWHFRLVHPSISILQQLCTIFLYISTTWYVIIITWQTKPNSSLPKVILHPFNVLIVYIWTYGPHKHLFY